MVGYFELMMMEVEDHDDRYYYYFGPDIHVEALMMVLHVEE